LIRKNTTVDPVEKHSERHHWQDVIIRFIIWLLISKQPTASEITIGLDWIRTLTNFVEFGLNPGCKVFDKSGLRTGFGLLNWKISVIFLTTKLFFWIYLDMDFKFFMLFGLWLDWT